MTIRITWQSLKANEILINALVKFQYGPCNESYYGECVRQLNVRISEHIGVSPLTKKPKLSLRTVP